MAGNPFTRKIMDVHARCFGGGTASERSVEESLRRGMLAEQAACRTENAIKVTVGTAPSTLGEDQRPEGQRSFERWVQEAKREGIDFARLSLLDLARTTMGDNWHQVLSAYQAGGERYVQESLDGSQAVQLGTFSSITGAIVIGQIRDAYVSEDYVFSRIVRTFPSRFIGSETTAAAAIPMWDSELDAVVGEGQQYEARGLNQEYWTWPAATKRGLIVALTQEAIFMDQTGQLLERASQVGDVLADSKERRLCRLISGETNNYNRNGTATNTFLTAGAYVNDRTGNELLDETDLDELDRRFGDLTDPTTGREIMLEQQGAVDLVVMPSKFRTAQRILGATNVRTDTNPSAGTSALIVDAPRVIPASSIRLIRSKILRKVAQDTGETLANVEHWHWYGDLAGSFGVKEIWPFQVFRSPAGWDPEFLADVPMGWKARVFDVPVVLEPRRIQRSRNASTI